MTSLSNQEIYDNLYELVRQYIKSNNDVPDDDKFSIQITGDELSTISLPVWDYSFDKPKITDIRAIPLNTLKKRYQGEVPIVKKATTAQLNRFEIPEGAMVWNITESKLMVYINGVWR